MSAAMKERRKRFAEGVAQTKTDVTGREQIAIEEDCPGEDFDRKMAAWEDR